MDRARDIQDTLNDSSIRGKEEQVGDVVPVLPAIVVLVLLNHVTTLLEFQLQSVGCRIHALQSRQLLVRQEPVPVLALLL